MNVTTIIAIEDPKRREEVMRQAPDDALVLPCAAPHKRPRWTVSNLERAQWARQINHGLARTKGPACLITDLDFPRHMLSPRSDFKICLIDDPVTNPRSPIPAYRRDRLRPQWLQNALKGTDYE